jgi:hypothetical protein
MHKINLNIHEVIVFTKWLSVKQILRNVLYGSATGRVRDMGCYNHYASDCMEVRQDVMTPR